MITAKCNELFANGAGARAILARTFLCMIHHSLHPKKGEKVRTLKEHKRAIFGGVAGLAVGGTVVVVIAADVVVVGVVFVAVEAGVPAAAALGGAAFGFGHQCLVGYFAVEFVG